MIYNGPSIYNQGGGGGYKDGGALVDGDFIEVTNNSISTYDNTSRDPVNFYFEVADGEIVNSVIEMTTAVNATVNVYVVKNGFYYLLGNVGGDTVTAGNDYKINVTGDSFSIETVSLQPKKEYTLINGRLYEITKINGIYWLAENLDLILDDCLINPGSDEYQAALYYNGESYRSTYGILYNWYAAKKITQQIISDKAWRVPTSNDFISLENYVGGGTIAGGILKSDTGWGAYGGTNDYNFKVLPAGSHGGGNFNFIGSAADFWTTTEYSDTSSYRCYFNTTNSSGVYQDQKQYAFSIRLVCNE